MAVRIAGARVVLPGEMAETDVVIEDGVIASVGSGGVAGQEIDGRGLVLAPGMIDIHGDAFERQLMPRPGVFFPLDAAMLETDRQLAANGITTAYHAVTLSWEPGLRAIDRGEAFYDALTRLAPRFTVENRIQLRWETFANAALPLIERALDGPLTPAIAFNDHTSMSMRDRDVPLQERAFQHDPDFRVTPLDDPRFLKSMATIAVRSGMDPEAYTSMALEVWARRDEVPGWIEKVADWGRAAGAPMLSHDDTQPATRAYFRDYGALISEFPMNLPVAEMARAGGDRIVFGAPNVVRGGSHLGSPGAADMIGRGLCDVLASDYFYPAMLAAMGRLVADGHAVETVWSQVSEGPAAALKLEDRGSIRPGLRADLVLIDWPADGTPAVVQTFAEGRTAYRAEARRH